MNWKCVLKMDVKVQRKTSENFQKTWRTLDQNKFKRLQKKFDSLQTKFKEIINDSRVCTEL